MGLAERRAERGPLPPDIVGELRRQFDGTPHLAEATTLIEAAWVDHYNIPYRQVTRGMLAAADGDIEWMRQDVSTGHGDPRDRLCHYHRRTGSPEHWYGYGFEFGAEWDPALKEAERAGRGG